MHYYSDVVQLANGISYPLRITDDGTLAISEGKQLIEDAIRSTLATTLGERVKLGNSYGIDEAWIFSNVTPQELDRLGGYLTALLNRLVVRPYYSDVVENLTVVVNSGYNEQGRVYFTVYYELNGEPQAQEGSLNGELSQQLLAQE